MLNIPDIEETVDKEESSDNEEQDADGAETGDVVEVETSVVLSTLSAEREVKSTVQVVMDAGGKQVTAPPCTLMSQERWRLDAKLVQRIDEPFLLDGLVRQVDWQDLADQIAANIDQPLERDQLAETLKAAVEASVGMSDPDGYGERNLSCLIPTAVLNQCYTVTVQVWLEFMALMSVAIATAAPMLRAAFSHITSVA